MGKQLKDVDIDERQFARVEAIILSMTPEERDQARHSSTPPASGGSPPAAALKVEDVNRLVKQYELHAPADEAGQGHGEKGPGFPRGMGLPGGMGGGRRFF